jgi:hypothetical protein
MRLSDIAGMPFSEGKMALERLIHRNATAWPEVRALSQVSNRLT